MSDADMETSHSGRQPDTANGNPAEQPTGMAAAEQPGTMRVLALYCTSSDAANEQDQGFDPPDAPNINLLAARAGIEVWCTCITQPQLLLCLLSHPAQSPLLNSNTQPCLRRLLLLPISHCTLQLEVMRGPSLEAFTAKVEAYRPTFVYISGPYSGLVDSIKGTVGPITLQGAYLCPAGNAVCVQRA
jgi:hypothetical protein